MLARKTCKTCSVNETPKWYRGPLCQSCYHKQLSPEIRAKRKAKSLKWARENKEYMTAYYLKRKYGISLERYQEMLEAQNSCCAICKRSQDELGVQLGVDHNHSTLRVRALLCCMCNLALGNLEDNLQRAESLVAYIKQHA